MILNIKVSLFLAGLLLLVHLGAAGLVGAIPVIWPVRLVVWGLLGWSLYHALRVHAWRASPAAIAAVELDGEGILSVRFAGSEAWHPCRVTARFVHPWTTLASLRVEGRRLPVNLVIAADAVEPEPFRRWRAALRLQTAAA